MSTRALLARALNDEGTRYEGVYVHYDGYPTTTGRAIYQQVRTDYQDDIYGAWCDLIYTHRSGYSSLHLTDRTKNACYCHTHAEGFFPGARLDTHEHAHRYDFTYALTPTALAVRRKTYGLVCEIPWGYDGEVPWKELEHHAYAMYQPTPSGRSDPGPAPETPYFTLDTTTQEKP